MTAEQITCVRAVHVVIHPRREMERLLQMRPKEGKQGECLLVVSIVLLKERHVWAVDVPHTERLTHKKTCLIPSAYDVEDKQRGKMWWREISHALLWLLKWILFSCKTIACFPNLLSPTGNVS